MVFWRIVISTNFRHNEQIRISPIFLINERDEKVGSVSTSDALRMAREAGLDLVEVAPTARPPVCKILDYGKWRYQQQKKDRRGEGKPAVIAVMRKLALALYQVAQGKKFSQQLLQGTRADC